MPDHRYLRMNEVKAQQDTAAALAAIAARLTTLDVKFDSLAGRLAAFDRADAAIHAKLDAIDARPAPPRAGSPPPPNTTPKGR